MTCNLLLKSQDGGKTYSRPLFHEIQDIAIAAKGNNSVHRRNTLIAGQLLSSQYYRICEVKKQYGLFCKLNLFGTISASWCLSL